jgi:hypothetical protein
MGDDEINYEAVLTLSRASSAAGKTNPDDVGVFRLRSLSFGAVDRYARRFIGLLCDGADGQFR